ncbi:hypothetical protein L3Q82_021487 [Scortum barcoo]|uniref:Uncharacterized protein n=1 Tax=Scortum barcoo TaxID=214431 RepID=A0ACB8X4Q1_9TELE|nr:hypothetical protein L3Q82_021487 [Scortum barcoo]
MIDFVVVSSDLRPYVLDTRVKRGAELSTDHHLVVSWIRWQRRKLDRPGRPKRIVRVCWERLAEPSVREVFNSHLRKSFSQIPREAGDIESEWTMFSASIVDADSSKLWDARSLVPVVAKGNPRTLVVDTGSQASRSPDGPGGKNSGLGGVRAGGELLTSTGDIVGRWKKYFEDLLNPTDLPSSEEAEAGDSEVDSSITRAEVTECLWSGKPGVVVPLFKKGTGECVPTTGDHTSQPPREGLRQGTERRIRPIVDPRIQEEQCGFRPGRGTLDQLYTLHRVLEGLWEFAQPVHMCFVDLEKAFDRVPRGILWGVLREYGSPGPLLRAVRSLYDRSRSLVRIAGRFLSVARGRRESGFGNHRISSLLFADDVVLLASSSQDLQRVLERFAAECEAAGMRISTSKSEAMVLDRKRVACPLRVGGEVLPQVEEFKYLGVLFTSEGKMGREIDRRIGAASAVMRSVYRTVVVKKELSRKAKLSITGQSTFPPSPMVMNFG